MWKIALKMELHENWKNFLENFGLSRFWWDVKEKTFNWTLHCKWKVFDWGPDARNQSCSYPEMSVRLSAWIKIASFFPDFWENHDSDSKIETNKPSRQCLPLFKNFRLTFYWKKSSEEVWRNWVIEKSPSSTLKTTFMQYHSMNILTHWPERKIFLWNICAQLEGFQLRPEWKILTVYFSRNVSFNF